MQRLISRKGFIELLAYRQKNTHWTIKLEFYLAQIAAVIYSAAPKEKGAKKLGIKDFLYPTNKKPGKINQQSDKMLERQLEAAKILYGEHQQNISDDSCEQHAI